MYSEWLIPQKVYKFCRNLKVYPILRNILKWSVSNLYNTSLVFLRSVVFRQQSHLSKFAGVGPNEP